MTRFVVDCGVVFQLGSKGFEALAEHDLLAPLEWLERVWSIVPTASIDAPTG